MYEIHLTNNQQLLPIDQSVITEVVTGTLKTEAVASAEIVIALVDDETIHTVNREHLQHDFPTDVISFLYDSNNQNERTTPEDTPRGAGLWIDGELVISTETAIREARNYEWNPIDELRLYLVHGLLHLCGYDDQSDSARRIMRSRERDVLALWNLSPHYQQET